MRKENILAIMCLAVVAGAFIFYKVPQNSAPKEFETAFEGKIVEYPDKRPDKTILIVEPLPERGSETVRVRISVKDVKAGYAYGEYIKVTGTAREPKSFEDFNWAGYLAKEGIAYEMYDPEIEKTRDSQKDLFYFAFVLRDKLQKGIDTSLLPPQNSLYSAMLLGDKSRLSASDKDGLAGAGLSHIAAISGLHIAVISSMLFFLFLALGMWRQHASILVLVVMAFYIIMIGAPASAVRAGIMVGILFVAQFIGRPNSSWRALLAAAAVMVLLNPYIARYDVGFQLSFLAVAGILLFSERIEIFFKKLQKYSVEITTGRKITKDRAVAGYIAEGKFGFISVIAMTLSAQALTFPIIFYNFGNFSLVSPITNLLVVPLLPFVLIAGFVSVIGGMAGGVVAAVLAAPAWVFSSYIWLVVDLF
ncbi:MAG: ComEC/Rec2 family competence protein [Candidatus Spechtbacterales bacterium]